MKRPLSLLLVSSLALVAFGQQWTPYTSKAAGVKISFPRKPVEQVQEVEGSKVYFIQARTTNVNYTVSSRVLPRRTTSAQRAQIRTEVLLGFTESAKAEITSQANVTYGGVKGRLYHFKNPNDVYGSVWIGETSNRIITLALAKRVQPPSEERKKFFGSFKLLK